MRFLIDASSDARLIGHLRVHGHDVTRVGTDYPRTLTDTQVLALAHREERILVIDDRDFGELVFVRRQPHAGVIYLRLDTTELAVLTTRLDDVLTNHREQLDQFLVVTPTEVRVRTGV